MEPLVGKDLYRKPGNKIENWAVKKALTGDLMKSVFLSSLKIGAKLQGKGDLSEI